MSAPNWQISSTYCHRCQQWKTPIEHKQCLRGKTGSTILVDIANFQEKCTKCQETWRLEDAILYCSCGNVQRTHFIDTIVSLEYGDQIIRTEGNIVHILKSSGLVVVGQRSFPDQGHVSVTISTPSSNRKTSSSKFGCGQTIGCLFIILILIGIVCGINQFITHARYTTAPGYHSSDLKATTSGSILTGSLGSDGSQYVSYISGDGHVHELYQQAGATWVNNDLTLLSNGTNAEPGSALTMYLGSDGSIHLNFLDKNQHVNELYFNPGAKSWVDNDLTGAIKGVTAAPGSALTGYLGTDGGIHVNFIGSDQHVHELYHSPGGNWSDNDLTALSGGSAAVSGSGLTGYLGNDGSIHVNFISKDQHIHELYFAGSRWSDNDLTGLSHGMATETGSELIGYWGSDNSVHVNFIGSDQHVHELYYNPSASRWSDNDLTSASGGTLPIYGSPLAGYWGSDSSVHVNFIGTDNHIHELIIHAGGNWGDSDLTALAGGTIPATGSTLVSYGGSDGSLHVGFVGTDRHIHELYT